MTKKDDIMDASAEEALKESELLSDVATSEEALGKIMALLANEDKYKLITELGDGEISHFAGLLAIADTYDIQLLKNYLKNYLLLRISKKRQGRKEIIEMGVARMREQGQQGVMNRFKSFFGGGRLL
jgi:hypothetical protein